MEDFLDACQAAVKGNEPKALAAKMGLPHVGLLQRANPDNEAHRLTVEHLFGILLHTGDMGYADEVRDGVVVRLPNAAQS